MCENERHSITDSVAERVRSQNLATYGPEGVQVGIARSTLLHPEISTRRPGSCDGKLGTSTIPRQPGHRSLERWRRDYRHSKNAMRRDVSAQSCDGQLSVFRTSSWRRLVLLQALSPPTASPKDALRFLIRQRSTAFYLNMHSFRTYWTPNA